MLNKLIIHPNFIPTLEELKNKNIDLPEFGEINEISMMDYSPTQEKVELIGELKSSKCDSKIGMGLFKSDFNILGYDESLAKFYALEGLGYIFSHSVILHGKQDYYPSIYISFYFYTRAKSILKSSIYIKDSQNPELDSKMDYIQDKTNIILKSTPENSIILIDGPLIGGQISSHNLKLDEQLLKRNILPIYIVKNSNSDLITQNIKEFKDKYNSDLHWAFNFLKTGEKTNFFKYVDQINTQNQKIFCYIKPFNCSPQRIEISMSAYHKFQKILENCIDLLYYLYLAQGENDNPQVRTIVIAELFARKCIKLFNIKKILRNIGLQPIMNEQRGFT